MSAHRKTGTLVQSTLALLLATAALAACSPKVYVIDNQTVLEEEAAGNWPQFEKQILEKSKAKGPSPVSQVPVDRHRERLYNVMNGEMPLNASSVASNSENAAKVGTSAGAPAASPGAHQVGHSTVPSGKESAKSPAPGVGK